jgi:GNAT superfamily N-acetyltransferase
LISMTSKPMRMTTSSADRGGLPLRRASSSDLVAVRRLIRLAYARYEDRMDRPPAPLRQDYLAETEAGLVWVTGEPIVGVIVLMVGDDSLLVENVAVDPAAQGKGVGRGLMEFAERKAREAGLGRLTLYANEVMIENLAIYRHLGYRETERRTEDGYRRVFMAKVLPD